MVRTKTLPVARNLAMKKQTLDLSTHLFVYFGVRQEAMNGIGRLCALLNPRDRCFSVDPHFRGAGVVKT
jgi:hypothetical protein